MRIEAPRHIDDYLGAEMSKIKRAALESCELAKLGSRDTNASDQRQRASPEGLRIRSLKDSSSKEASYASCFLESDC